MSCPFCSLIGGIQGYCPQCHAAQTQQINLHLQSAQGLANQGIHFPIDAAQDPRFYSKERKAKDYAAEVRKRKGMVVKRG